MLSRTLKMAFWVTYDHLGKLILANFVWFIMSGIPGLLALSALATGDPALQILFGGPLLFLSLAIGHPIASAGLAHMIKELIETRDGSVRAMFSGMRIYGLRAAGLGVISSLILTCLATSVWFYAVRMKDSLPWVGYGLSGISLWCLALFVLMLPLLLPALVQKKAGIRESLKISFLLVLDNPFFLFGLAIQLVAITAISVIPIIWVCISGSLLTVMASSAYEIMSRKYAIRQMLAEREASGTLPEKRIRPISHRPGQPEEDPADPWNDAQDDYLNRGFRDFLFPWKG
jgi:uncharacterized membrane protein YesL